MVSGLNLSHAICQAPTLNPSSTSLMRPQQKVLLVVRRDGPQVSLRVSICLLIQLLKAWGIQTIPLQAPLWGTKGGVHMPGPKQSPTSGCCPLWSEVATTEPANIRQLYLLRCSTYLPLSYLRLKERERDRENSVWVCVCSGQGEGTCAVCNRTPHPNKDDIYFHVTMIGQLADNTRSLNWIDYKRQLLYSQGKPTVLNWHPANALLF